MASIISSISVATKPFLSPSPSSTAAAPRPHLLPQLLLRHPPLNSFNYKPRRSRATALPLLPRARGGRKVPSFSLWASLCGRLRCWFTSGRRFVLKKMLLLVEKVGRRRWFLKRSLSPGLLLSFREASSYFLFFFSFH